MTGATRRPAESWLRVLSLLAAVGVWQVAAMVAHRPLLPTPAVVAARMGRALVAGDLPYHLTVTLARVAASFVLAMGIGTAVGILMGRYRRIDAGLDGLLILGLNIPVLVTAIVCYIWLGLGEVAAITAVALNKIPTVVVMLREGARAVDRELLDVATVFRVPGRRTLWQVYLPQLYPHLMAAARAGLALVWKIVLVVELLGRSNGIGFQLGIYFQFFDITSVLAYTLAFAATILAIEAGALRPMERHLTRWRA